MTDEQRMKDLRSPKAIVGQRQIAGEGGGAVVFCVVLADGFILECGCDGYARERACLLAETINAGNPEAFNFRSKR